MDTSALTQIIRDHIQKALKDEKKLTSEWIDEKVNSLKSGKIHIVTHVIKFTHTGAQGTSINANPLKVNPNDPLERGYLSTRSLKQIKFDCVSTNIAALLPVATLLLLEANDRKLFELLRDGDYSALEPFATYREQAQQWCQKLLQAIHPPQSLSADTLIKQIFFPVHTPGNTPEYHLLSPLFASSLAQTLDERIHGSKNFYPNLLTQTFGGRYPQNVSLLNSQSQRDGKIKLFSCAPPHWDLQHKRPPTWLDTIFSPQGDFHRRTKGITKEFQQWLMKDPPKNKATRDKRDAYVNELLSLLFQYAGEIRCFPPGWSIQSKLPRAQRLWLDPDAEQPIDSQPSDEDEKNWHEQIASDFAGWLNWRLNFKNKMIMSDTEHQKWYDDLLKYARQETLNTFSE